MPASVYVSADQLAAVAAMETDVVFNETGNREEGTLEIWVMDPELRGDQHRSVIMDNRGEILSNMVEDD